MLTKPLPLFDGRHDFSLAFRFRKEPGSAGFLLRQASRWGQDGLGLTTDGRFQYFNPDAGNTDLNSRVLIDDDKAPRWLLVTCRDGGWSLRIYFNGELAAQGGVRSAPKPNDAPLQVGSQMRGSIEEVRMYERVLGLEEVRWLVGQE